MTEYRDFSSLSAEDESKFVVYERRSQESAKKAIALAAIISAVVFVVTIAVVFSHDPPKNLMEDDDMGMLDTPSEAAPATKATKVE